MTRDYEVVVVGGGPVGVMALALLGHAGIPAVGIERERDAVAAGPRRALRRRDVRSFQAIGLGEEVFALCKPMCDFRMENEAGETLMAFPTGQWGPQAWHDDLMFHQPEIDALLRAEVERLPGVELRLGHHAAGDRAGRGRRSAATSRPPTATTETLTARWVIACDGATSTVRRLLGIANENLGTDDPWLVVDGHLRDAPGHRRRHGLPRPPHPAGAVGPAARRPGPHGVQGACPATTPRRSSLPRRSPGSAAACSRWASSSRTGSPIYTFRARVAEKWRVGNVFLAGDAAHQAPPLFGQGLCAGLRDVANLVWKLRLVSAGRAAEDLLDTYESERRPHARYWVEKAATHGRPRADHRPRDGRRARRLHPRQPGRRRTAGGTRPRARAAHRGRRRARRASVDAARAARRDDVSTTWSAPLPAGRHPGTARRAARRRSAPPLEEDPETVVLTAPEQIGRAARLGRAPPPSWSVPTATSSGLADTPAELEALLRLRPDAGPRRAVRRRAALPQRLSRPILQSRASTRRSSRA